MNQVTEYCKIAVQQLSEWLADLFFCDHEWQVETVGVYALNTNMHSQSKPALSLQIQISLHICQNPMAAAAVLKDAVQLARFKKSLH